MGKKLRLLALGGVSCVALIVAGAEVAVRLSGVANFPIYQSDSEIGYILAPGQQGAFLNKNHWVFNEKSQGTGPWKAHGKKDLLLLGDSIVLGGNPLDQADKLGPQLQENLSGWQVWPVSAGSWAAANEIIYLHRYPEVAKDAEVLVWIFNTGDLDGKSVWKTDVTHPRSHPVSALWYVFDKYVLYPRFSSKAPEGALPVNPRILPESIAGVRSELARMKAERPERRVLLVLYPALAELGNPSEGVRAFYEQFRSVLAGLASGDGDSLLEIRKIPVGPPIFTAMGFIRRPKEIKSWPESSSIGSTIKSCHERTDPIGALPRSLCR